MAKDEQALIEAIAISPLAMVVSNPRRPDNPLELVNGAFCDLTGYPEAEIVGRIAGSSPASGPSTASPSKSARPSAARGRCWSISSTTAATDRHFATV
jgi:hypothetical protein